jgi:hypothetical protein
MIDDKMFQVQNRKQISEIMENINKLINLNIVMEGLSDYSVNKTDKEKCLPVAKKLSKVYDQLEEIFNTIEPINNYLE